MTDWEQVFHFQIARDFYAIQKIFVRIFDIVNKESKLKAIYKLPISTTTKCDEIHCNGHDSWLKAFGEPTPAINQANYKFVFEYPYKEGKPVFAFNFCLDCIENKLKKYVEELIQQFKTDFKRRKEEYESEKAREKLNKSFPVIIEVFPDD